MGIFYEHSEDEKYHIYRMRSRLVWFGSMILIITLIVFPSKVELPSMLDKIFLVFLGIIILVALIEYTPIGFRKYMAHFRKKEEIAKGNIFRGDVEIKIEK